LAYRGDVGWTRETHLVSGNRTTEEEIKKYLESVNTHLFVALENNEVVACVCVEEKSDAAYIGMLAVHPRFQKKGMGKNILAQAENYALATLEKNKFVMLVVSQRKELIEYYQRRGYVQTGKTDAYPIGIKVGVPVQTGLTIEYLEKNI
ncbi:hypothetical protein MNBD_GAMMA08-1760, partial [hydrothermal vent metagenome]